MDFNKDKIKESAAKYLRENWKELGFFINSKEITPTSLSNKGGINVTEGDFGDDYNFKCEFLHLRLMIENCEKSYEGECYLKVSFSVPEGHTKPTEFVEEIKDNRILIKLK